MIAFVSEVIRRFRILDAEPSFNLETKQAYEAIYTTTQNDSNRVDYKIEIGVLNLCFCKLSTILCNRFGTKCVIFSQNFECYAFMSISEKCPMKVDL